MIPDDAMLSAYIDCELPDQFRKQVQEAIQSDGAVRQRYDRLAGLQQLLHDDDLVDCDAGKDRVLVAITTRVNQPRTNLWQREIRIPFRVLVGAAATVAVLLGFTIWSLLPRSTQTAADYLSQADNVDVTFRLDSTEMEHVLQWLVEKNMLGELNIEIPEAERFEFIGEPVFLKSSEFRERSIE